MKSMSGWATDQAPHHRAAYVHTWRLINERIERERRLIRPVPMCDEAEERLKVPKG
jgi:hypothetical protein